ncbi:hypothetical protein Ahy_A02g006078 isoform A [Arachis hypogaea]|uniref:RRM domain-containing protein n=1 Tax=Arachis hypogaea TaxID=3818 RepID=A0A445E6F2_ARAHY|nr:hypothetical protein Ahy_A02g005185 isoform B [Arachis hypogaea]RYR71869.1 hypothetical protein Ahy_A02g006078 isoform A [Arachis hypogaea]
MRPVFCGNLDFDARQSDVERLFKRYGKVERVDMKSGLLGKLECPCSSWVDVLPCISFLECAQASCIFPDEII